MKIRQHSMKLGIKGLDGQGTGNQWGDTKIEVHYNTGGRGYHSQRQVTQATRFYVPLPQIMADGLGVERVYADSEDHALEAFKEALKNYKALKTEKHRVIVYEFDLSPRENPREQDRLHFRADGVRVQVWAGTYVETMSEAGDGKKRYTYEKQESSLTFPVTRNDSFDNTNRQPDRAKYQVPWTEANERFFRWVEGQMRNLIERLCEIEEPNTLLEMVAAGRLLPLGQAAEPTEDSDEGR